MAGPLGVSISPVCSIITTASAPRGTAPPVAIALAVPTCTSRAGGWPEAITSALSKSRRGARSPAPMVSAAPGTKGDSPAQENASAASLNGILDENLAVRSLRSFAL